MAKRFKATVGVFGIPQDSEGRGLWSKRADGKGLNLIGGGVDPEDSQNEATLNDVLKREFMEEAGLEIELIDGRPIGVYATRDLSDIAIVYAVRIVSGIPQVSSEDVEYMWLSPGEIRERAERYDKGDHANGLLGGVGKRQWQMAKDFLLHVSSDLAYQKEAQSM